MGMDLKPARPTKDLPIDDRDNKPIWLHYNWAGWSFLLDHLEQWGVKLDGFEGVNDGKLIRSDKCREVAAAIEEHLPELTERHQAWLRPHITFWKNCGGCRQY